MIWSSLHSNLEPWHLKVRFKGMSPSVTGWLTGYENFCKKNINCVSGGAEIEKVTRKCLDAFFGPVAELELFEGKKLFCLTEVERARRILGETRVFDDLQTCYKYFPVCGFTFCNFAAAIGKRSQVYWMGCSFDNGEPYFFTSHFNIFPCVFRCPHFSTSLSRIPALKRRTRFNLSK